MISDEKKTGEAILHSFPPIFNQKSKVLILGTMPSPASLAVGMFYSHPRNAFWKIVSDLFGDEAGKTTVQKIAFLLRHGIALWDTLESCTRPGASDGDIRNYVPNDIVSLISKCPELSAVFLNGSSAFRFYRKFHASKIPLPYFRLTSTSPANCGQTYAQKLENWSAIRKFAT